MFTVIDYIVMAAIFILLVAVVRVYSSKLKNVEDYYVANRSIPFSLLIGTLVATWYGGQGLLNSVEAAAVSGLVSWGVWCVGAHISRIPLALWFAPQVSVRTEMTVPQMLRTAYGKNVAFFQACFILFTMLALGEIVALRNVLAGVFGTGPAMYLVPIMLLGIAAIAAFGGMMGVAVSDMILFWCLCTGTALAVPPLLTQVGGIDGLMATFTDMLGAEGASMMFNPIYGAEMLGIITMLIMSLGVYTNAQLYQRFSAADSPRSASRSYLTAFCIFIMLDLCLCLSGICMAAIAPGTNIAQSYVATVIGLLPPGLKGLFLVGMLGAIITTICGMWLVFGMTVANDVIPRFKTITPKQNILIGRICMLCIGIIGYLCTFVFTRSLDVTVLISTMNMSVTFIIAFMGIFYKGRKTVFSAWLTIIVGSVIFFTLTYIVPITTPYGRLNGMLVALPVGIVVYFVGNRFGRTLEEIERDKLDAPV